MSSFANELHEALCAHDLVPDAERVHFLACSTGYRSRFLNALERACGEYDPDDMRSELQRLEKENERLTNDADEIQADLERSEEDVKRLKRENGDLEEQLAEARQRLEDSKKKGAA